MTRAPSDRPARLEAIAVAERLAGTVRRHLLTVAQASLRIVRELLAKLPSDETAARPPVAPNASRPPTARADRAPVRATPKVAPAQAPSPELLRASGTLPAAYGSDRLVLLARDPHCLYAYWDLSRARDQAVRADAASDRLRMVLRTYDVTQIPFDAEPPRRFQDFAVTGDARSLYAYLGKPAACFVAEIGYLRPDGAFFPLARSLPIWTPRTDQPGASPGRWMTVGWNENRDAGEVVPLATTTGTSPAAVEPPARPETAPETSGGDPTTGSVPSSWPGPAPSAEQRGSWSLVHGGLASPTTIDTPPVNRGSS